MATATATIEECPKYTPWGPAQTIVQMSDGAWSVGTAGHGGIKLNRKLNAAVPDYMRCEGGWYEEDCDWAIAVTVHPTIADGSKKWGNDPDNMRQSARDTLCNWHPDAYARFYGVDVETLAGKSYKYDQLCFERENADNWVVISAFGSWHENVPEGFAGVVASKGGKHDRGQEEKYSLVAVDRYHARGRFGYVLQADDHPWTGPDMKKNV